MMKHVVQHNIGETNKSRNNIEKHVFPIFLFSYFSCCSVQKPMLTNNRETKHRNNIEQHIFPFFLFCYFHTSSANTTFVKTHIGKSVKTHVVLFPYFLIFLLFSIKTIFLFLFLSRAPPS